MHDARCTRTGKILFKRTRARVISLGFGFLVSFDKKKLARLEKLRFAKFSFVRVCLSLSFYFSVFSVADTRGMSTRDRQNEKTLLGAPASLLEVECETMLTNYSQIYEWACSVLSKLPPKYVNVSI